MADNFDLFGEKVIVDPLLRDKYIEPPFSILDAKGGAWQQRKKNWLSLGIKSEEGRDVKCNADIGTFKGKAGNEKMHEQTSIFDPVLCELMYRWFCVPGGQIIDSFAGGSVRGVVANYLGYLYTGVELSMKQVISNRDQCLSILPRNKQAQYYQGDSEKVLPTFKKDFDMIFSCPPYLDLEVYSNDESDLSNMEIKKFTIKYESIIEKSVALLKNDSFAVFVVGDVRNKLGYYQSFPAITTRAFEKAGAMFYNDLVLATAIGNTSLTTSRNFPVGRKCGKIHQNVLVYYKGNPKNIRDKFVDVEK